MHIKILGPGCAKCNKTAKLIEEVVKDNNIDATITKVTDMLEIAGHGVMGTPSVIINEEVKCVGKVPKKNEILSWVKPE